MKNEYTHLNGVYKEIADEFGYDTALRFHKTFKGLNISFPVRFYSKENVMSAIKNEFDGQNIKELAKKYDYSDRWIRKIIKDSKIIP